MDGQPFRSAFDITIGQPSSGGPTTSKRNQPQPFGGEWISSNGYYDGPRQPRAPNWRQPPPAQQQHFSQTSQQWRQSPPSIQHQAPQQWRPIQSQPTQQRRQAPPPARQPPPPPPAPAFAQQSAPQWRQAPPPARQKPPQPVQQWRQPPPQARPQPQQLTQQWRAQPPKQPGIQQRQLAYPTQDTRYTSRQVPPQRPGRQTIPVTTRGAPPPPPRPQLPPQSRSRQIAPTRQPQTQVRMQLPPPAASKRLPVPNKQSPVLSSRQPPPAPSKRPPPVPSLRLPTAPSKQPASKQVKQAPSKDNDDDRPRIRYVAADEDEDEVDRLLFQKYNIVPASGGGGGGGVSTTNRPKPGGIFGGIAPSVPLEQKGVKEVKRSIFDRVSDVAKPKSSAPLSESESEEEVAGENDEISEVGAELDEDIGARNVYEYEESEDEDATPAQPIAPKYQPPQPASPRAGVSVSSPRGDIFSSSRMEVSTLKRIETPEAEFPSGAYLDELPDPPHLDDDPALIEQVKLAAERADPSKLFGECLTMAPYSEFLQRIEQRDIAFFEKDSNGEPDFRRAVKQYKRPSANLLGEAEYKPEDVRPGPVLYATMEYLINLMDYNHPRYFEVHNFVSNRARSIRQDYTVQGLHDAYTLQVLEWIVRFHIYGEHFLCEEDSSNFSLQQNMEQLSKTLTSCQYIYSDFRQKGVLAPNEAEFIGYVLLLADANLNFITALRGIPPCLRNEPPVLFAIKVRMAIMQNNFVGFFKLLDEADYFQACLMHRMLPKVRDSALRVLNYGLGDQEMPLEDLMTMLRFEYEDEAIEYINLFGLRLSSSTDVPTVIFNRRMSWLMLEDHEYPKRRRYAFIEEKRFGLPFSAVVKGGPKLLQETMRNAEQEEEAFEMDQEISNEEIPPQFEEPMNTMPEESEIADVEQEELEYVEPAQDLAEEEAEMETEPVETEAEVEVEPEVAVEEEEEEMVPVTPVTPLPFGGKSTPSVSPRVSVQIPVEEPAGLPRFKPLASSFNQLTSSGPELSPRPTAPAITTETSFFPTFSFKPPSLPTPVVEQKTQTTISPVKLDRTKKPSPAEVEKSEAERRALRIHNLTQLIMQTIQLMKLNLKRQVFEAWRRCTIESIRERKQREEQMRRKRHEYAVWMRSLSRTVIGGPSPPKVNKIAATTFQRRGLPSPLPLSRMESLQRELEKLNDQETEQMSRAWKMIDIPMLLSRILQRKNKQEDELFWKLTIAVPEAGEDEHEPTMATWITTKLSRGEPLTEPTDPVQTLAMYSAVIPAIAEAKLDGDEPDEEDDDDEVFDRRPRKTKTLRVSVKRIAYSGAEGEEVDLEEVRSGIYGTQAVMFYLPSILPHLNNQQPFWTTQLRRLEFLISALNPYARVPLVIAFSAAEWPTSDTAQRANVIRQRLLLDHIPRERVSSINIMPLTQEPASVTDPRAFLMAPLVERSAKLLEEALQWLALYTSAQPKLVRFTLRQLVERKMEVIFAELGYRYQQAKLTKSLHIAPTVVDIVNSVNNSLQQLYQTLASPELAKYNWPIPDFVNADPRLASRSPPPYWNTREQAQRIKATLQECTLPIPTMEWDTQDNGDYDKVRWFCLLYVKSSVPRAFKNTLWDKVEQIINNHFLNEDRRLVKFIPWVEIMEQIFYFRTFGTVEGMETPALHLDVALEKENVPPEPSTVPPPTLPLAPIIEGTEETEKEMEQEYQESEPSEEEEKSISAEDKAEANEQVPELAQPEGEGEEESGLIEHDGGSAESEVVETTKSEREKLQALLKTIAEEKRRAEADNEQIEMIGEELTRTAAVALTPMASLSAPVTPNFVYTPTQRYIPKTIERDNVVRTLFMTEGESEDVSLFRAGRSSYKRKFDGVTSTDDSETSPTERQAKTRKLDSYQSISRTLLYNTSPSD